MLVIESGEKMTAKQYLSQSFWLDGAIKAQRLKIEQLEHDLTSAKSLRYSDKVQTTAKNDRLCDGVAKLADLRNECYKDIERLAELKKDIGCTINCVDNLALRTLLSLRYESFLYWEKIAVAMSYSDQTIYRLHKIALQEVDKMLHYR